jgi:hypothetical protein
MAFIHMQDWRVSAAVLIFVASSGAPCLPATAADRLENLGLMTGTCERLVIDGKDLTGDCAGKIIQSIYDDGRTGWYMMIGDKGAVVTLSGMSGAKPDADSQLQDLDSVIWGGAAKGAPAKTETITGQCLYSNPNNGPTSITCIAKNQTGDVSVLEFRTDGKPPEFMKK